MATNLKVVSYKPRVLIRGSLQSENKHSALLTMAMALIQNRKLLKIGRVTLDNIEYLEVKLNC